MKNISEIQELLEEIKDRMAWANEESTRAGNGPDSHPYMRGWYQSTLETIEERVRKIEELINEHS